MNEIELDGEGWRGTVELLDGQEVNDLVRLRIRWPDGSEEEVDILHVSNEERDDSYTYRNYFTKEVHGAKVRFYLRDIEGLQAEAIQ